MCGRAPHLLHLCSALILTFCAWTQGSFLALTPKFAYPGLPFNVVVTAHQSASGPVMVTASLQESAFETVALGINLTTLLPGETKILSIHVPLLNYTKSDLAFLVSAVGGVNYSKTGSVAISHNSSVILVQTDKSIYRPGQKVRIRVVNVDQDLRPIFVPLTVIIENPKNDKLEEYKDINSRNGVVERIFELSDHPTLGIWKIHVNSGSLRLYTSTFKVEEFVLPKFSVSVQASPEFIITSSENGAVTVTVSANYTYGKGVQGECELTVHYSTLRTEIFHKELDVDGVAVFKNFAWSALSSALGDVTLQAEVTDETGRKEQGQAVLAVYSNNIRLKIQNTSTTVLRYGLPAHVYIEVSDYRGNPVSPVNLTLQVSVSSIEDVTETLVVPAGQTLVRHTFIPRKGNMYRYLPDTISVTLNSQHSVKDSVSATAYKSTNPVAVAIIPLDSQVLRVGEPVSVKINKSLFGNYSHTLSYLVASRGNLATAGTIKGDSFSITPTLEFCPFSRLLVYMIVSADSESSEVVVDAVDLTLSGCFSKEVKVEFDSSETRTGTEVDMKIDVSRIDGSNAMPGVHDVFYLAVDQSIVLLQGSTDLNREKVVAGLSSFDHIDSSMTTSSAEEYFERYSLLHMTTASVSHTRQRMLHMQPMRGVKIKIKSKDVDTQSAGMVMSGKSGPTDSAFPAQTSTRIRKDFPDTWLWGQAVTDANGHLRSKVTLPDTITSWIVSAFAVNDDGLAVAREPFKLTAFQLFFLSMNLPYSIKRGEIFVLKVTVFNYRNQNVEAFVSLAHSDEFLVLDEENEGGWYKKPLSLAAYRASSVSFRINATTIGQITLHVTATDPADGQKDEVKRELLVKPEGVERSRAITKVLMLESEKSINESFFIHWPRDKIVPDSQRVEIKITGEVFGQALSGLDNLVSVPFGCGEQNMITTVPNIFGLKYIRGTAQEGMEELVQKLTTNMKKGYQRQVENYRHKDGSFSAWGGSSPDSVGSTWLTAFVIRSFAQASEFISIDESVLTTGIQFLKSKQNKLGSFVEDGIVLHSEMKSGTGSGEALSVYVLVSLLEASQALGKTSSVTLSGPIDKAVKFIKEMVNPKELKKDKNIFLAALTAYSLSLVSTEDKEIVKLIEQLLMVVADSDVPWTSVGAENVNMLNSKQAAGDVGPPYAIHRQESRNLEIAAYLLLTYHRLNKYVPGLELMKWLQSQQNSKGGFHSTQDTVMVLQALSEFGSRFKRAGSSELRVTDPVDFSFKLSGSRALLLQTKELPSNTNKVSVLFTGDPKTIAVVKVVYSYYTLAGEDDTAPIENLLFLKTKSSELPNGMHRVEACVRSSSSLKYNGMYVMTMSLPSGEKPAHDVSTILAKNTLASKVEADDRAIHFYLDQTPTEDHCLTADVEPHLEFEVQKPGSARFYPYYQPENVVEVPLSLNCQSCDTDTGVVVNMASVLLTTVVCLLASLLACM